MILKTNSYIKFYPDKFYLEELKNSLYFDDKHLKNSFDTLKSYTLAGQKLKRYCSIFEIYKRDYLQHTEKATKISDKYQKKVFFIGKLFPQGKKYNLICQPYGLKYSKKQEFVDLEMFSVKKANNNRIFVDGKYSEDECYFIDVDSISKDGYISKEYLKKFDNIFEKEEL